MVRLWFLLVMFLGACVQGQGSMQLLRGDLRVTPPAQYCIDKETARQTARRAVVLIGKCSGATGVPAALITLSFGEPGSARGLVQGPQALIRHLQSPAGRASLARDGRTNSVQISQISAVQDQVHFHVQDRNVGPHWRAALGVKGRLAMVSVTAPEGGRLSNAEGKRLLQAMIRKLREAN